MPNFRAALNVIELAGGVAAEAGRPLDDNPYDPERYPGAYAAWARGWRASRGDQRLAVVPRQGV